MRLVSNKESVARGEVSILAIVETLLAIALVFYLSAHFNTLRWLAVAMCVSPLLLLRTEESTQRAIRWWALARGSSNKPTHNLPPGRLSDPTVQLSLINQLMMPSVMISIGIVISAWALAIRASATLVTFLLKPTSALKEIPNNWGRMILTIDSLLPPELIPDDPDAELTFEFIASRLHNEPLWDRFYLSVFVLFAFLPSFLYRWSLKATSIIYAPLVFVAHSTFRESSDLRTKLELIKRGDLSRIRVWYGVIAIAAFLVKFVLMMNLPGFADWWNGHPVSRFLALYVAPAEIPKWQLAELANSALAIGAMLFARRALLGYELQHPWPEVPVKRLLGFVSGLRWVLALYAILCTGYITMRAAQHWHWPALGEQWLPW